MSDPDLPIASETPADAAPPADPACPPEAADVLAHIEALAADRDRLDRERSELNDRYLRLIAEFDNFRKRSDRERCEAVEYGSTDALKAMLPILDDFERALKADSTDLEYARGMALIYQRMSDALRKLGLEPIATVGAPFDPNLHHAIDSVQDPGVECDTVAAEYQRGYSFKSRLLRAAMVRVAVKG
jgi:molecular chaperone GrpE